MGRSNQWGSNIGPAVLGGVFGAGWGNPVELHGARKAWYLLLRVFWLLLPKLSRLSRRYHVSFYLWLIGSVLRHCKVPKYYDQDCGYNIFVFLIKTTKFHFQFFFPILERQNDRGLGFNRKENKNVNTSISCVTKTSLAWATNLRKALVFFVIIISQ